MERRDSPRAYPRGAYITGDTPGYPSLFTTLELCMQRDFECALLISFVVMSIGIREEVVYESLMGKLKMTVIMYVQSLITGVLGK